mgnify:CR=1 FL=1
MSTDAKPKKFDRVEVTTSEFLQDLYDTETIFFEILEEKSKRQYEYGIYRQDAASIVVEIDKYNATNPPAKIIYDIEVYGTDDSDGETEIEKAKQRLFGQQQLRLVAGEGGNIVLTSTQFRQLYNVFKPFFYSSYGGGELIQHLFDKTKQRKGQAMNPTKIAKVEATQSV